jgi:hypothetical protein
MADVVIKNIVGQLKNESLMDDDYFKKSTSSDSVTLVSIPPDMVNNYIVVGATIAAGVVGVTKNRMYSLVSLGAETVNLPAIAASLGMVFHFKNTGIGTWTIDPSGAETIDGMSTVPVYPMENLTIGNFGTEWVIL